MNILYIGDIMAEPGMLAVERVLPELIQERQIGLVIAQAENVTAGKGLSRGDYERLRKAGIDGFTGGNHTTALAETEDLLTDPSIPITGPANMPDCAGPGYKYISKDGKKFVIISLLGHIVGKHAELGTENPLQKIDSLLASLDPADRDGLIINFHGDFSSEKVIIGHYLDGRATMVVGDHWHVPTADAQVQPKGTAHISDVGMCGALDSSLGVTFDSVVPRWRDGLQTRNELELGGRMQFNALLVTVDDATGRATAAEHIRRVW